MKKGLQARSGCHRAQAGQEATSSHRFRTCSGPRLDGMVTWSILCRWRSVACRDNALTVRKRGDPEELYYNAILTFL
jgi:hypothetical protein